MIKSRVKSLKRFYLKNKNIIICFCVNIIISIILFIIMEFICFVFLAFDLNRSIKNYNLVLDKSYDKIYETLYKHNFRETTGIPKSNSEQTSFNSKQKAIKPILLLGCSYAYGHSLKIEDTFGYKLSELTKRTVYNRSFDALWGVHNAYYMFNREDFFQDLPEINTIIYLYIPDCINRAKGIYMMDVGHFEGELLRYIKKDGKFYQYSFWSKNPVFNLSTFKLIKIIIFKKIYRNKNFDEIDFCKDFFIEIRDIAKSHWKNVEFIILNYYENDELMDKLKEEGFKVINMNELTNINLNTLEYQIQYNDNHPNGKAWDIVTPAFVKVLNNK